MRLENLIIIERVVQVPSVRSRGAPRTSEVLRAEGCAPCSGSGRTGLGEDRCEVCGGRGFNLVSRLDFSI